MKLRALALFPVVAVVVGQATTSPADAAACSVEQLTTSTGGTTTAPTISDDGTVVAFTSDRDLVGQNTDGEPRALPARRDDGGPRAGHGHDGDWLAAGRAERQR